MIQKYREVFPQHCICPLERANSTPNLTYKAIQFKHLPKFEKKMPPSDNIYEPLLKMPAIIQTDIALGQNLESTLIGRFLENDPPDDYVVPIPWEDLTIDPKPQIPRKPLKSRRKKKKKKSICLKPCKAALDPNQICSCRQTVSGRLIPYKKSASSQTVMFLSKDIVFDTKETQSEILYDSTGTQIELSGLDISVQTEVQGSTQIEEMSFSAQPGQLQESETRNEPKPRKVSILRNHKLSGSGGGSTPPKSTTDVSVMFERKPVEIDSISQDNTVCGVTRTSQVVEQSIEHSNGGQNLNYTAMTQNQTQIQTDCGVFFQSTTCNENVKTKLLYKISKPEIIEETCGQRILRTKIHILPEASSISLTMMTTGSQTDCQRENMLTTALAAYENEIKPLRDALASLQQKIKCLNIPEMNTGIDAPNHCRDWAPTSCHQEPIVTSHFQIPEKFDVIRCYQSQEMCICGQSQTSEKIYHDEGRRKRSCRSREAQGKEHGRIRSSSTSVSMSSPCRGLNRDNSQKSCGPYSPKPCSPHTPEISSLVWKSVCVESETDSFIPGSTAMKTDPDEVCKGLRR